MLDDRPTEDVPVTPAEEPVRPFNFLYVGGVAAIAMIAALLAVSGLLVPLLVFGGAIVAFILVQALIFRVFPPPRK